MFFCHATNAFSQASSLGYRLDRSQVSATLTSLRLGSFLTGAASASDSVSGAAKAERPTSAATVVSPVV